MENLDSQVTIQQHQYHRRTGAGGDGLAFSISGSSVYYGGGGGGSTGPGSHPTQGTTFRTRGGLGGGGMGGKGGSNSGPLVAGTTWTDKYRWGGGAAERRTSPPTTHTGGHGGSGIVIISYPTAPVT